MASTTWKPSFFWSGCRCRGCGTKLSEPVPEKCPGCHRLLAETGIWSQFLEWEERRHQGRLRFLTWETLWIGTAFSLLAGGRFIWRWDWPMLPVVLGIGFAAGHVLARIKWSASERDYLEWKQRQST